MAIYCIFSRWKGRFGKFYCIPENIVEIYGFSIHRIKLPWASIKALHFCHSVQKLVCCIFLIEKSFFWKKIVMIYNFYIYLGYHISLIYMQSYHISSCCEMNFTKYSSYYLKDIYCKLNKILFFTILVLNNYIKKIYKCFEISNLLLYA